MSDRISRRLRQSIERRAAGRCEYCRCPLAITTESFAVEHVIPTVRGGATSPDNLALSCSGCNGHKYDKVEGRDPVTQSMAPLYHPRQQTWSDHFAWSEDYVEVIGLTPTGRTTVETLHLNRQGVVNLRRVLFLAGLHPPAETESEQS